MHAYTTGNLKLNKEYLEKKTQGKIPVQNEYPHNVKQKIKLIQLFSRLV